MGKCQTCENFEYRAGIGPRLGIHGPSSPTCYCHFAGVSWARTSHVIRKPIGIKCKYKKRNFICTDCGKQKSPAGALIISSSRGVMVCKKCLKENTERGGDLNGQCIEK